MLTKSQIKLINSLAQKKFRIQQGLFCVEGIKGINEFLKSDIKLNQLFSTERVFNVDFTLISENELKKISRLKTPNTALALFEIPKLKNVNNDSLKIALDNVRDPGNLGTIIRLCDWFGVNDIICNLETVDCYNPKVVQATMGSLSRVRVNYLDLESYLSKTDEQVFGAFMNGDNVYKENLPNKGVIIMGNEANGISSAIESLVSKRLSIPQFGASNSVESLNVATATAILLSEFKR